VLPSATMVEAFQAKMSKLQAQAFASEQIA